MTTRNNTNGWIDKFKNPAIWFAALSALFWISIRLNNVDVLEERLDKKIKIINEQHEKIHTLELRIEVLETKIELTQD